MAADDLAAAWPRSLSPQPGLCPHSPHQGQLQSSAPQPAPAVARCTDGPVLVVMLQFDLAKSITHYTARPRFVKLCRDHSFVAFITNVEDGVRPRDRGYDMSVMSSPGLGHTTTTGIPDPEACVLYSELMN